VLKLLGQHRGFATQWLDRAEVLADPVKTTRRVAGQTGV